MLRKTLVRAAGMAVALGIAMEIVVLAVRGSSAMGILPVALNEILFPIGCAMVLFVSGVLARTD